MRPFLAPRLVARGIVVGCAVGALAACNSVDQLSYRPAPSTTALPTTTVAATLPDGSAVALSPVPGTPTTTMPAVTGGQATISGIVLGPQGAVAGATVLAQRVLAGASASATAITGPDGSFSLAGLLGGDYRVRAWETPTLALATPDVFFLGATQLQSLNLSLTAYDTPGVAVALNPSRPVVGEPLNLAVQVTMPSVGSDGIVENPALSGATVTLANGADWDLDNATNPQSTGTDGEAVFEVTCTAPGVQPLQAAVNDQPPVALDLPACAAPPPPTTTTSTTTTTTTTSTTLPPGGSSSTSTTP